MNAPTGFKQRLGAELAAMEQARAERAATGEEAREAAPARRWTPGRRLVISAAGVAAAGIAAVALPALGHHPAAEAQAYSLTQSKDGFYHLKVFDVKGLPQAVKDMRAHGIPTVLTTVQPKEECRPPKTVDPRGFGYGGFILSDDGQNRGGELDFLPSDINSKHATMVIATLRVNSPGSGRWFVFDAVDERVAPCYGYKALLDRRKPGDKPWDAFYRGVPVHHGRG